VLQCVAVRVAVCCSVLQCVAVCCSVLQCVAVCCSVLQCVAVCCSALQGVAAKSHGRMRRVTRVDESCHAAAACRASMRVHIHICTFMCVQKQMYMSMIHMHM